MLIVRKFFQFIAVVGLAVFFARSVSSINSKDEANVLANRGIALLEQFRFTEAVDVFEAFVELRPREAAGYINLGIAYFNERNFKKARSSFEQAREFAPESAYVHYNLGLIHKLLGETKEAVVAFERVASIDTLDALTHYHLGLLYANLGRLVEAEESLHRALELSPNNTSAHFSLGNVLIRQGRREEGRERLAIFRAIKESFPEGETSVGFQYTELGKYAEAIERPTKILQPILSEANFESSVSYEDVSAEVGLKLPPLPEPQVLPKMLTREKYNNDWIWENVLPQLGSGISFRDLDGDNNPELLFVRGGAPILFKNTGGHFEPVKVSGLPTVGRFLGVIVGDVDNDADGDVYLTGVGSNELYLNDGTGQFTIFANETVRGEDISVSAAFADIDHDGDLDLYVSNYLATELSTTKEMLLLPEDLPGGENRLYRNNGNGSFTEISADTRTGGGESRSLGAMFSDFDEDRDIDFVVINDGSPALVFSNDRVGTFTESSLKWGFESGLRMQGVDSADFDRDGRFDVFLTASGAGLNMLLRGSSEFGFLQDVLSPGLLTAGVPGPRYGTGFVDVNNDADQDLLVVVNEKEALAAYYENTPTGFVRALSLKSNVLGEGRAMALADGDGDGDVDVVVATERGELAYFRNDGGNQRKFLKIRAEGLRSNFDGLGVKVEVKAGETVTRREVRSFSGYFSQSDLPLHFGLNDREHADYVRFLWPGGVKQIEMEVAAEQTAVVKELNRKGTSCPVVYAWDGNKIRFVTDFLGGSAIGRFDAPGRYSYPDTEEVVKMEQFSLVPNDGSFEIRWVNQLEELIIYDYASLLVVDHPKEVEVFPNERLMPTPPYPEKQLFAVADMKPVLATDHKGQDVTNLVSDIDYLYPQAFDLLPFKGYAETHTLTLNLGELSDEYNYVLLLYGWVDYVDSSSNLAASQAGIKLRTPYLEVGDGSGRFEMALPEMGFPAGLPKTMLVDLEGIVNSARNQVRITTSMPLYWDQILVARKTSDERVRLVELLPNEAELRFIGYPERVNPDQRQPARYTYDRISDTETWGTHEGYYTRYGDVRELLGAVDDAYVLTHHGDELRLRFDEKNLPSLPDGWTRSFMMVADGFGKDMDLNSASSDRVEPLPFHGMTEYPYSENETFPMKELHRRYTTRYVGWDKVSPFTVPKIRIKGSP